MAEEMEEKTDAPKGKAQESSLPKSKWSKSTCIESTLLQLVEEGLLQLKEVVQWRAPESDSMPYHPGGDKVFGYLISKQKTASHIYFFMLDPHTHTVQIDQTRSGRERHEITWHQIGARSNTSCAPLFGAAGIKILQSASKRYDCH